MVWLYLLEASQRRALEMATFSIVRLDVEPLKAALSSWMVVPLRDPHKLRVQLTLPLLS